MVRAIVGANWGDEGKGKITDMLAEKSDIVVRFQGGHNAGHTIINEHGRFALHLLPSGSCYPHIVNVLGNGVALDIRALMKELEDVRSKGISPKLLVSDRAQIVMPYHVDFDVYEEERLGKAAFGSTKSGIAPFFSDKYAKIGFQVNELFYPEELREKLHRVVEYKNLILEHVYHKPLLSEDELFETMMDFKEQIQPYVADTAKYLQQAIKDGKTILMEGQLGTMKDPDFGIYPMVTSSSPLASYSAVGAGIPARYITDVICVTKAYSSAVGAGEFVSEIFGDEAQTLRLHGGDKGEFGATTGRPRRVGWYDTVASRYGVQMQGATEVALTAIDCLSYLDEIPMCVGYEIDGSVTHDFPVTPLLKKAKPVLKVFPGWKKDIRGITEFDKLPKEAQDYVLFIEKELGVPVTMVSTGPKREEIILR